MVLSLLYKSTPEQVRLIMIDPKMLELSVYEGIPHLLAPVVTDMKEAANALRWCVAEMERRYALLASLGVRHIPQATTARSAKRSRAATPCCAPGFAAGGDAEDAPELTPLPFVVVNHRRACRHDDDGRKEGRGVDSPRLAQKARASGIHVIIATQAAVGGRDHGAHQGQHPVPDSPSKVSAKVDSRDDSRSDGRGGPARARRICCNLPSRCIAADPHSRRVRLRQRGAMPWSRRCAPAVSLRTSTACSRARRRRFRASCRALDAELDSEQDALYDQAVRIVTGDEKGVHIRYSTTVENRLQPSGPHGRGHGRGWHCREFAVQWIQGGTGAAPARRRLEQPEA